MAQTLLGLMADDMLGKMTHTTIQVGNITTPVLNSNPSRRFLLITNDSNEVMYLAFGKVANLHQGIRLEKNGGSIQFSLCDTSMCPLEVNAIQANSNPGILLVTEGE